MSTTIQLCFSNILPRCMKKQLRTRFLYLLILSSAIVVFSGNALVRSILGSSIISTQVQAFNTTSTKTDYRLFSGKKIRSFNHEYNDNRKNKTWQQEIQQFLTRTSPHFRNKSICEIHNWAVVVNFSNSVLETAKRLSKWCIVIVVKNRPDNIKVTENIFFLNATIQNELAKISPLYKASLLYAKQHHIVQKNLGYLWTILHGATIVWDFDNDNELIVNESTFSTSLNETMEALTVPNHNSTLLNPYPFFVSNPKKLWPRGYPSQSINDSSKQIVSTQTLRGLWPTKNIGIIHSLTECQVDVDSVYKSVVPGFPLRFQKISNDRNKDVKLIAPRRTFSPYNKQSTLHLRP
ncbi:unnamed protein product, partial [Adineta steineri]